MRHLNFNRNFVIPFLWLLTIVLGFSLLAAYSSKAAEPHTVAQFWPASSKWSDAAKFPTLVVFLHPHCGCSRASAGELEKLLPIIHGKVRVIVSFYQPLSIADTWSHSNLWRQLENFPNVEMKLDRGGQEAQLFHAQISGETFFYGSNRQLLFHGGLTPSRGHMGDNFGRQAIIDWAQGRKIKISETKVFGCQIRKLATLEVADGK